jgi:hypothetical protein
MAGKTISVAVDDEMYLQFQHALLATAATLGVDRISPSVVLREIINRFIAAPQAPFDAGWMEGYRAGYAAVMRVTMNALHELQETGGVDVEGLGIGVGMTGDGRMPGS